MTESDLIAPFLTTFFRDFLVSERNLSPHTIASYRDALKLFLQFVRDQTGKPCTALRIEDVDGVLVRKFLAFLEEGRGNSIRSRNHRLAVLRSFFEYVVCTEPRHAAICQAVAAIPLKKCSQAPVGYLERQEIEAIFKAVDRTTPEGTRDHALLLFLYNTGARVHEAASLHISSLTLTKPYRASLLGKGRKWRICPLWVATGETLRDLLANRAIQSENDYVFLNRFGRALSRHGILDVVKKYVKKAEAECPSLSKKRISPHTVRHTTAMHLLQSGVELNAIRSWLGHASLETTHQYAQIDLEMKTRAMERCEALFSKTGDLSRTPTWKANPDIIAWLESL